MENFLGILIGIGIFGSLFWFFSIGIEKYLGVKLHNNAKSVYSTIGDHSTQSFVQEIQNKKPEVYQRAVETIKRKRYSMTFDNIKAEIEIIEKENNLDTVSGFETEKEIVEKRVTWQTFLNEDRIQLELKEAIKLFLSPDNISPYYFMENMKIIKASAFYSAFPPLYNGTISMNKFGNVPKGYPIWFAAAYPDVLVWFMDSLGDKSSIIYAIFNSNEVNEFIEDNIFTQRGLMKLVKLYKANKKEKLECQR